MRLLPALVLLVASLLPLTTAEETPNAGAVRILTTTETEIDAFASSSCTQTRYCGGGVFAYVPSTGFSFAEYHLTALGPLNTIEVGVLTEEASLHVPVCPGENPFIGDQCVGNSRTGGEFTNWRPDIGGSEEVIIGYVGNGAMTFDFTVRNGTILGRSDGRALTFTAADLHGIDATVLAPSVAVAATREWVAEEGGLLVYSTVPFPMVGVLHSSPAGVGSVCAIHCTGAVVGPPGPYRFLATASAEIWSVPIVVFADIPPP